jgi:hypothetical protein
MQVRDWLYVDVHPDSALSAHAPPTTNGQTVELSSAVAGAKGISQQLSKHGGIYRQSA